MIWMIGAHVVKRGLAPLLIDLMERGVITHLASNGAATIHDFEIALQGSTSEDVASSLENGSFGMAEETGALMNRAIRAGARDGLGMGEALGRMIAEDERFKYRQYSLLYTAYRLRIPYTVHVALGTDIIHQHPTVDFAATGWASGQDFKIFTASVCELEGGVFCNFGSVGIRAGSFPESAVDCAQPGQPGPRVFTTANFDLVPLGDYRRPVGDDQRRLLLPAAQEYRQPAGIAGRQGLSYQRRSPANHPQPAPPGARSVGGTTSRPLQNRQRSWLLIPSSVWRTLTHRLRRCCAR